MPGELQPLIAYLFSEWKCNLDCHYCWSYDNSVKGMTEPVARQSIDWLHSLGNRFLALMGGEPLLRPKFIHKIVYYAAKKDFIVYLPTNGRLMKPDVIDRLGDAGLGTVNTGAIISALEIFRGTKNGDAESAANANARTCITSHGKFLRLNFKFEISDFTVPNKAVAEHAERQRTQRAKFKKTASLRLFSNPLLCALCSSVASAI